MRSGIGVARSRQSKVVEQDRLEGRRLYEPSYKEYSTG
jgi:hypothetical protein